MHTYHTAIYNNPGTPNLMEITQQQHRLNRKFFQDLHAYLWCWYRRAKPNSRSVNWISAIVYRDGKPIAAAHLLVFPDPEKKSGRIVNFYFRRWMDTEKECSRIYHVDLDGERRG